ncbi:31293_t:CDS:2, partial [Gigaspora margarita]
PKTDKEWFDLMESYISKPSNPKPQAYYFLDLDIEVPWPVPFPENEEHREYAKDMFKVDGAEYAFSTWFVDTEEHKLEAGMTEERAQEILNAIDNSEYLIRIKFIRANTVISDKKTKRGFKIINKYEPIHESKKAGRKYIRGSPNVILTKKTKPGFWVEIDKKFLVREVRAQFEVERLDSNAHFDQAKRGYGLTKILRQKINDWEKKMRIPGARVHDIAELEKILKRPITLLDITHGTIFNSKKYRSGKYEEIEMVVHNGHAFPRNQHFSRDQMVEYYKGDTWEAINNALQEHRKKHIEIIEACKQLVNDAINCQYQENIINEEKRSILLESLKVVDLAEQVFGANHAGSRLANKINEWYPISEKINNDIKRACVEHGHGGRWNTPNYHINNIICIDMKECYPAIAVNGKLLKNDITGFAQVRSFKFAPNIHPVIPVWYGKHFACRGGDGCIKEKGWAPIVLLQYLLGAGILEDLMVEEVIISLTKQTKVWLPNNRDISCVIIGKFTQGSKIDEKRLTYRLVTDENELNFLIKDCTDAGTFAGREKCPLGFILTYYKGYQSQYTHLRASILAYAHINLLEMLRRFEPNKVIRIATDSIYVRKEALYKIENVPAFFKQEKAKDPDLCPHTYPLCAICTDPEEFFISKSEYAKWIK